MRFGIVIVALMLLGAGAWWMYTDREQRLDEPEVVAPPAGQGAVVPTPLAGRDSTRVLTALPGTMRDVLEGAERFEILALHPDGDAADGKPAEQTFHSWLVLGRAAVTDRAERRTLVEELYRSLDGNAGEVAECFLPRHGIQAVKGDLTVDLVICFECLQTLAYQVRLGASSTGTQTSGYLLAESEAVFDAALKRHGLTKHARDDK